MRRAIKRIDRGIRLGSGRLRVLPDFIIIGGQRCGTTALFNLLGQHPCVETSHPKEVHYFDLQYARPLNWYRQHFPTMMSMRARALRGRRVVSGEPSPYYLFHPRVPERLHDLPGTRLIALLRNPVDRAYSHYQHEVRLGVETLPFEDAIAC
jgi:hypothetical protein